MTFGKRRVQLPSSCFIKKSCEKGVMSMKQKKQKQPLSKTFKKIATNKVLYIMLVPCMIYTFIFSYYPLTGWIMAFENYKPAKGYWGSKFVGFDQFRFLFEDIEFWRSMRNTLAMSVMNLIFSFLFAIVFALLLNEIKSLPLKRLHRQCHIFHIF